jgi:GT2 family glycosyltransferase
VYEETIGVTFETIVVDNASTDGSVNMVQTEFPLVTLIANKNNRGFAAANNQGIRIAKGRYLLLLNSDTVVSDNAIAKTVRYADQDPDVAVVGCQVWENQDQIQMTCFRYPSVANLSLSAFGLAKLFRHNKVLGREWMLWWKRDTEREVDVVSGMFMLVRHEAIDQVGLLDEHFFMYCEEVDWCYRFAKAGWKVLFWPGAQVIHVGGGSHSSSQIPVKMFVQQKKSLLMFLKKHRGIFIYLLANLIVAISSGLRVCSMAVLLALKKILRRTVCDELMILKKNWASFKFCTFRLEPE